jgi:hypothetical protein
MVGVDERTQHTVRDEQRDLVERLAYTDFSTFDNALAVIKAITYTYLDLFSVVCPTRKIELELEELP